MAENIKRVEGQRRKEERGKEWEEKDEGVIVSSFLKADNGVKKNKCVGLHGGEKLMGNKTKNLRLM